jgi:hypothetical protein
MLAAVVQLRWLDAAQIEILIFEVLFGEPVTRQLEG